MKRDFIVFDSYGPHSVSAKNALDAVQRAFPVLGFKDCRGVFDFAIYNGAAKAARRGAPFIAFVGTKPVERVKGSPR